MIINSCNEMKEVARKVLSCYPEVTRTHEGALLLFLKGDLGAGKTTFVQALAGELGVQENVTSPTFVIQKQYKIRAGDGSDSSASHTFARLIHIDAYRLETLSELEVLGWGDFILDSKTIVALEWPEHVQGVEKHERSIEIEFLHVEENSRNILFGGKETIC